MIKKRRYEPRRARRRGGVLLVATLVASLLGLAASVPAAEAQQPPTPPRPLLLIGGTFAGHDFPGHQENGDDDYTDPGEAQPFEHTADWFEVEGGYTEDVNLFRGELKRQEDMPANWSLRPWYIFPLDPFDQTDTHESKWGEFVDFIVDGDGSTAGLAAMQESADYVKGLIALVRSMTSESQIDIVAHSQGGAIARAAIRQFHEDSDPSNDDWVHTLVSLGSGDYGASVSGPEFDTGSFLLNYLEWNALVDCRDNGWLPVCPDFFRKNSSLLNYIQPVVEDDNGNPELYRTSFIPALNTPFGKGPTPGNTDYYHISSHIWEPGGAIDDWERGAEYLPLPTASNVENWTAQQFCEAPAPGYDVHHVQEWQDPVMQHLIGFALGFDTPDPTDWDDCF